jgi:hypothetical protein
MYGEKGKGNLGRARENMMVIAHEDGGEKQKASTEEEIRGT